MKSSLSIILFLVSQTLLGQTTYNAIFINQCTNEIDTNSVLWCLVDSSNGFIEGEFDSIPIDKYKSGSYQLYSRPYSAPINVYIKMNEDNKDTFLLERLEIVTYASNPPFSEYIDCDGLANGKIVDLYRDGKIRRKGVFKEGQPIDTVFNFYRNGQLSSFYFPGKNWKKVTYYKNGQIHTIDDSKEQQSREYYPNGELKKLDFWGKQ